MILTDLCLDNYGIERHFLALVFRLDPLTKIMFFFGGGGSVKNKKNVRRINYSFQSFNSACRQNLLASLVMHFSHAYKFLSCTVLYFVMHRRFCLACNVVLQDTGVKI